MNDLAELSTFVTVARAGSFAEAARRLGLSPAMVGRRVQALEDRYGARLVERTTRSLRLTAIGQDFLAKAAEVIEAVDDLAEMTHRYRGRLSGRIRMSGPTTLGTRRLAGIVARLTKQAPELTVELSLSDRKVDLIAEGFDLAVRIGDLSPSGLIARRVGTYHFACCASPQFLERHGAPTDPQSLVNARCVLNLNFHPPNRWPFRDSAGCSFAVELGGSLEIDNDEAQRAAALDGAGFIYVPRDLVVDDLRERRLVEVFADWPKAEMPIHILHPSRRLVPHRVTAMIQAVAEGLREG